MRPRAWSCSACGSRASIDWPRVARDYAGFELRLDPVRYVPDPLQALRMIEAKTYKSWLAAFDVPSGCIWDIKSISDYSRSTTRRKP